MAKPGRKPGQLYPSGPNDKQAEKRLLDAMRKAGHVPPNPRHPLESFENSRLRDALDGMLGRENHHDSMITFATMGADGRRGVRKETAKRYLADSKRISAGRLAQISECVALSVGHEKMGPLALEAESAGLTDWVPSEPYDEPSQWDASILDRASVWAYETFVGYLVGGKTPDLIRAQRYVTLRGVMELDPEELEMVGGIVFRLLDLTPWGRSRVSEAWGAMAPGPRNAALPYPTGAEIAKMLHDLPTHRPNGEADEVTAVAEWAKGMASRYKNPPDGETPF